MALSYCIACDSEHLPGDHRADIATTPAETRPGRGGRHLAQKPSRQVGREPNRPAAPVRRLAIPAHKPIRPVVVTGIATFLTSCKEWGTQTARGLRDAIDVGRLTSDLPSSPRHTASEPLRPGARTSVGLLERPEGGSIELSMLESLGFYSDSDEMVVTLSDAVPPGIAPLPPPSSRSQVPDMEIGGWRPHTIARSKLGRGRLSSITIVGLSVSLIILVALVASLLQAPAATTARQTSDLSAAATDLAGSLSRLDAVIADPTGGVAETSALLLNVDRSARDLFDQAASLPDDTASRQSAIGAAQSALALKTALGDALSYRVLLEPLWQSPDLEGTADSTAAAAGIAEWQVGLADVIANLPTSPELADHVEQVRGFIAGVESWRIRYLDAVTAGDLAAADAAAADLEGQMAILAQSGEGTLSEIFVTADAERARLIRGLAEL